MHWCAVMLEQEGAIHKAVPTNLGAWNYSKCLVCWSIKSSFQPSPTTENPSHTIIPPTNFTLGTLQASMHASGKRKPRLVHRIENLFCLSRGHVSIVPCSSIQGSDAAAGLWKSIPSTSLCPWANLKSASSVEVDSFLTHEFVDLCIPAEDRCPFMGPLHCCHCPQLLPFCSNTTNFDHWTFSNVGIFGTGLCHSSTLDYFSCLYKLSACLDGGVV